MKDNIQTLLNLFNNLNDEDKLILYDEINNIVKQKYTEEDIIIDYEKIMSLSWFQNESGLLYPFISTFAIEKL